MQPTSRLVSFKSLIPYIFVCSFTIITVSAGFTYWLDRLKPRSSQFRGPPAKVYNI